MFYFTCDRSLMPMKLGREPTRRLVLLVKESNTASAFSRSLACWTIIAPRDDGGGCGRRRRNDPR